LSPEDIKRVEDLVNKKIQENIPVTIEYTSLKDALKKGALAFFGDKYKPEKVRIVGIDTFSTELCGGTHCPSTGIIGVFKITEVAALSAGHRRIFAVTGPTAVKLFQDTFDTVKYLGQEFKVKREEVEHAVLKQKEQLKHTQKQLEHTRKQLLQSQLPTWEKQIESVNDVPFLFLSIDDMTQNDLREIGNNLVSKNPGFYFLISSANGRSMFVSMVSEQFANQVNLKNFAEWLKDEHGLRGGVKKNTLQGGGGKFDTNLKDAIKAWLKK